MKPKLVKTSLNENMYDYDPDENMYDYDPDEDYYPEATEIADELIDMIEDEMDTKLLKRVVEFDIYIKLEKWAAAKKEEVDKSY